MDDGIRLIAHRDARRLHGFAVAGRYPRSTSEWMMMLVSMLHQVATVATLPHSTLFHAMETPDRDVLAEVEPVAPIGPALEEYRHRLLAHEMSPLALLVLHPAGAALLPELDEPDASPIASGALLLPGLPDVGLDHRAAWAAVDTTGSVQLMQFTAHACLNENVDVAVLGTLIT